MPDLLAGFRSLPPYGIAGVVVLLLYAAQSELRFGRRARAIFAGPQDRGSTIAVSLSAVVPLLGFALALKVRSASSLTLQRSWLGQGGAIPGMPAVAWAGVGIGALGILVRLWAVLALRERYTRTLQVGDDHAIERGGPYRLVRHPGYLGSLLCLNGLALASGNAPVLVASVVTTLAAYAYRIRVEDAMLVSRFGEAYELYRREVRALVPFL
ncbi:MAG TPA: isoprenylcysteine carboxylmethyltransferase family protein [Candidatus Saccharimonadales bacterium]|nr:isoprenylcysteine carboxylmethyltransferase family protein [Candidatus Saccharimonadales bacterium]